MDDYVNKHLEDILIAIGFKNTKEEYLRIKS